MGSACVADLSYRRVVVGSEPSADGSENRAEGRSQPPPSMTDPAVQARQVQYIRGSFVTERSPAYSAARGATSSRGR